MKNLRPLFTVPLFLLFVCGVSAQNFPRLEADPKAAEYARRASAALSWELLAEISLWASGAPEAGRYMDALAGAAAELLEPEALPADGRERGEYILDFMHKKFLKRYSENQTRLDTLISGGNYNCLSSAVLYAILASAAGLEIRGVITKDHAFIKFVLDGAEIDIETTNPYGFDPGNRKDFHDGFGTLTGFAYVPAGNYRNRADISPLELASLIFSNRITELERRGRFAEAIALALNREVLLSFNSGRDYPELFIEPRKMVMDRIFNYGASLVKQGKDGEALLWADFASPLFPDAERWDEFAGAALNNIMVKLIRAERFSVARETLDANAERSGPLVSACIVSMRKTLAEAETASIVSGIKNQSDADAALELLRRVPPDLDPQKLREFLVFVILKKGEFVAKDNGWQAAAAYMSEIPEEYGRDRRFEEQLRVFRTNRIAELHNNFAAAYNRRDYENAGNIISAALEEFPGDRRFLQDKSLLERASR